MKPDLRPIYLCGPTASGKTAAAIALAQAFEGEIINADAYQLYRGLDHITAAPSSAELAAAPHHLFGVLSASEPCDAMRFREMALPVIASVQARGKLPIIAGGSGLYHKFLTHGPSPVPPSDPATRAQLEARSDDDLIAQLSELDPTGAEMTNLQNRRYVIRALEICLLSGKPMSVIKSTWQAKSDKIAASLRGIYLDWPTDELYPRINERTEGIVCPTALEELSTARPTASETASKAIGFREICDLIDGKISRQECVDAIAQATRRYAKRQRTWFRNETWLTRIACPTATTDVEKIAKTLLTIPPPAL